VPGELLSGTGVNLRAVLPLSAFYYNFYMIHAGSSDSNRLTGHLWTISVEQHFYIVFAFLFILFELGGFRRALYVLAAAGCLVRLGFATAYFNQFDSDLYRAFAVYANSFCHFDAFAIGALIAISRDYIARHHRQCVLLFTVAVTAVVCYGLSYFWINYHLLDRRGVDVFRDVFSGILYGQHREVLLYGVVDLLFACYLSCDCKGFCNDFSYQQHDRSEHRKVQLWPCSSWRRAGRRRWLRLPVGGFPVFLGWIALSIWLTSRTLVAGTWLKTFR
jgi:hypothetical protein